MYENCHCLRKPGHYLAQLLFTKYVKGRAAKKVTSTYCGVVFYDGFPLVGEGLKGCKYDNLFAIKILE